MIIEKLLNKTVSEKVLIKGQEFALIKTIPRVSRNGFDFEIVNIERMAGGIIAYVKAWKNGTKVGFGGDGSVEIEKFKIYFSKTGLFNNYSYICVPDLNGSIELEQIDESGKKYLTKFKEDPVGWLINNIGHTLSVKKQIHDDKNIVEGKVGNTTSTFNPEAGEGVTAADTELGKHGQDATLTAIRTGTATLISNTSQFAQAQLQASATTDQFSLIRRCGYGFDLTALSTDTIDSAVLSLFGQAKTNSLGSPAGHVGAYTPTDFGTPVTADFGTAFSYTSFASVSYASFSDVAYNDLTLNASGLAHLSAAITGLSFLTDWDINNNFTGTWSGSQGSLLRTQTADTADSAKHPKLVIEHTAGGGGVAVIYPTLALLGVG